MSLHRGSAERWKQVATAIAAVAVLAFVVFVLTHAGSLGQRRVDDPAAGPAASPSHPAPATVVPTSQDPNITRLDHQRLEKLRVLAQQANQRQRQRQARNTPFVVSSLNVLGASHTSGPGSKPNYRTGSARILGLARVLLLKHVSVVGLQEFQAPQDHTFQRAVGAAYAVYPGMTMGARTSENSIAWRKADWKVVSAHTISIPYFYGHARQMPYVQLQSTYSGKKVWFANFHNPADVRGNAARWRHRALQIEASLVRRLHADGSPVILTGDMNDREAFACPFTAASGMHSADAVYSAGGRCYTHRGMDIDWIMGTPDVGFTGYLSDYGPHRARLTDHPMVTATVTLTAS
ncbi:endonuclease/exonuclease/phosphatase family protein [Nocardioides montaniterrae]